jgi:two-component system response regulator YesN
MYNVLLVDDDVAVLEFMQMMIPWESCGFQLSGTYTNAYESLQHCREAMPDLIVTDIGMPGMDGMELIKAVKDMSQHPRFVILSCHDEFRYAQQAVQMGIQDYILKETLDTQAVVELLLAIKAKIEEEKKLHTEIRKLHFQAHRSKSALKENWLRDLISKPVLEDPTWMQQLEEFGLHPVLPYFIPVVGRLHRVRDALIRYKIEDTVKFIVQNAIEELVAQEPDILFFSHSAKEFCLLFNFRKELKTNPHDRIIDLCKEVQQKLMKVLKLPVSILLGEMEYERSGIKRQFVKLIQNSEQLFYSWETEIVKSNQSDRFRFHEEDLFTYYYEYAERMNRLILEGNKDASVAVDPFIHFISTSKFPPKVVKQFVFKLVQDIMMKLKFNHQYTNEKVQQELEQLGNIGELQEWLIRFAEEAVSLMEVISKQSKKLEIVDAQKYVRLRMDQKISLEDVSNYLHLNPSYFSRLFKKETGENFIEYVTRIKMERAKNLLSESNKTVETISQLLGYDNKGYFVKVFKQHYGVIPSKFV